MLTGKWDPVTSYGKRLVEDVVLVAARAQLQFLQNPM
jgi:hypothetical protein